MLMLPFALIFFGCAASAVGVMALHREAPRAIAVFAFSLAALLTLLGVGLAVL